MKNITVQQNLMNFKNGIKIQKPPASLALRQESNFNMFKNLFSRISGPKGKEILTLWRKMHNEKQPNF
jgi:hypothetical protein